MRTTAATTAFARPTAASKGRGGWSAALLPALGLLVVLGDLREAQAEAPSGDQSIRRIGPTATVEEVSTGLPFAARVDTGATTCSIHYEELEIEDASPDPAENVGKSVRFLAKNRNGVSEWIEAKIVDHVVVRTSERADERYKVRLTLRWQDVEKDVLVTLNNRERMTYPMLLGRNFLHGDILVDVALRDD